MQTKTVYGVPATGISTHKFSIRTCYANLVYFVVLLASHDGRGYAVSMIYEWKQKHPINDVA